ncbi:nucleotidyl transferase AbiEii/AbiGii toxin family protein [Patescibacteria group bacterium]|nr:nucleotidyl transferase AbiEii/AbiGii toxin family protein [Patescibacteria group bacterium]MBU0879816.1 nucleotidyl transferase AbiEii/AbiGii toxin family protein [Patescibacteria group bacterium]MBU0880231.1 nucleotidyl transferase AbiEii/AbiGii toxin family protein [Patescibacteria group bacterium]MBU0897622.1 nucleotidyl transferase AbiEii/AbiGii toxin family protein [Patescibacteria group bacterium]MBU1062552.1 nucleotidyl transferase AbiEii/AbiGii toxin family protein [Patescibacteria 
MILPNPKDAKHKAWLYRLLIGIYDNPVLSSSLYFKGGTCAAMCGFLDRFSIDLDFDFVAQKNEEEIIKKNLEKVFKNLGLEIKEKSQRVPQYFLKYPADKNERNIIKIDVAIPPLKSNKYELVKMAEIDRIIMCQTIETMFANKLVALIDRYEKNNSIAGRDIYDIHYFFFQGFRYNEKVIEERRKKSLAIFFKEIIEFIEKNIDETIINQDINMLLSYDKFNKIRKVLKSETLMFLRDEERRLRE